jgi:hypothetical protein
MHNQEGMRRDRMVRLMWEAALRCEREVGREVAR